MNIVRAAIVIGMTVWTASASGGAPPASAKPGAPSLLLITIDTWRWDHLGISGAGKVQTPNLDRLAKEGVYERECLTPCPLTTPAHASMFTGLLPARHGVLDCTRYRLNGDVPVLAQSFLKAGYRTAAFVSGETLKRRYGLDRGYELYDDSGMERRRPDDRLLPTKDGAVTTDAALQWLAGAGKAGPVFLWVHFFDLHEPYRNRPGLDEQYPGRPYAAQAAYVDQQVGRLMEKTAADGRSWRIVIVGDHGEGLGDHGEAGHGLGLYRSTLDVPLIIYPRPARPLSQPRPWSLIDLAPTLLAWFNLPAVPGVDGLDLFTRGGGERLHPSLTLLPTLAYSVNPVLAVRRGHYKFVLHGEEEFYDLASDPDEQVNLKDSDAYRAVYQDLRKALRTTFTLDSLQRMMTPSFKPTRADLQQLRSLGYLSGPVRDMKTIQRANIQDVMQDVFLLDSAKERQFAQGGDPAALEEAYRAFIDLYPAAVSAWREYGKLLLRSGKNAQALDVFGRVMQLDPEDAESAVNLGTLCLGFKQYDRAVKLLEKAIALDPEDPAAYKNLALFYGDIRKDPLSAAPLYRKYLELEPKSPDRERIERYLRGLETPADRSDGGNRP